MSLILTPKLALALGGGVKAYECGSGLGPTNFPGAAIGNQFFVNDSDDSIHRIS